MKIVYSFACIVASTSDTKHHIITANDTAEPPTVSLPPGPLHENKTWPTPAGINKTEARRICEAPILESPVFDVCRDHTVQALEFISHSCMLDLLVSAICRVN